MTILVIMKTVGVAELKANLSRMLDLVKAGGELVITEHGEAVARVTPIPQMIDSHLRRLAAEGKVRLPSAKARLPAPEVLDRNGQLVEALLEERSASP